MKNGVKNGVGDFWDWIGLREEVRKEAAAGATPAAAAAARPAAQEGVASMLSSSLLKTGLIVGGVYVVYRLLR